MCVECGFVVIVDSCVYALIVFIHTHGFVVFTSTASVKMNCACTNPGPCLHLYHVVGSNEVCYEDLLVDRGQMNRQTHTNTKTITHPFQPSSIHTASAVQSHQITLKLHSDFSQDVYICHFLPNPPPIETTTITTNTVTTPTSLIPFILHIRP